MSEETATIVDRDSVIADIAAALGVEPGELTEDTNLLDAGLDSVRLMQLVEKWRSGGAPQADFVTLAADPVLGLWLDVVAP
ncbi:isochorismatase [Nocardia mangyaensis]|uniref:Isochorismatase n=1 Tax=Nocardia mangyaensis TaxID=2213200 RepID=A0A1J0VWX4_9NOCA|nr:phosphopantetheine-binding protein [Nocardia mangyaensis]APE36540.1 isochorismatase [Nocardia mangyaensis]MDO3645514.1 phosphopantetheine-binding protein [Nocardia mangyaensis]